MEGETLKQRLLRRAWGMFPALLVTFLIVLIIVLSVAAKNKADRLKEEKLAAIHTARQPVNVVVLNTAPTTIRDTLNLPAVVEPWVGLELFAEVSGKVRSVEAKEGDRLSKGDVIAVIDTRDYENAVDSVQAKYDLAIKTLERMQNLYEEQIVPRVKLDEAQAAAEGLEAELRNAGLRLERCVIKAPMAGYLNRLDAKEGLFLNVMDPVGRMLETDRVKVVVGIPESDVDAVRGLRDFSMTFQALGGEQARGRKLFLSKNPDNLARLYRLEIEVANPGGKILPGMFARVDIVKKVVRGAVAVPLYSVISRQDRQLVFLEEDGKARAREVKTGILEGWMVEVTEGLSAGDRVIVVGHRSVDDGHEVNVVRTIEDAGELYK